MFGKVGKIALWFNISLAAILLAVKPVYAQEITAIDFNGDLIGKVIPDGTVVSFDNTIIGNVTADSFIVNAKGELIGGVIPQGIAVGNDNKLLGRVNNDGSVRLPSGKIVGKVLPNALVVDDSYNILGSVLYPGLVYDDAGKTVGRLTGDGSYISMEGQNIGFISPLGYAYRNTGNGFGLDGKLISAKMVISPEGNFIGSVTPGGRVTDFASQAIGFVHANGYVYDENDRVIGKMVTNGYAFDNYGNYLGLIAYNGEVINEGKTVARLRADDKVIDEQGSVIGFSLDIAATATDLQGKYLGRLMPGGKIAKARETVGTVGAKGFVWNADGEIIGQIIKSGPVFDYVGNLIAQSLRNGTVISTTGTPLGYAKGRLMYDNIGRLLGAGMDNLLVFDNSNNLIGLSGIGSDFSDKGIKSKISPFGYVYSADNLLIGHTVGLEALYQENGAVEGYVGLNGDLQGIPAERNYKLTQFGAVVDSENNVVAASINPLFFKTNEGANIGYAAENNLLLNEKHEPIAKILPEYALVSSSADINDNKMPVIGTAGKALLAVGINGNMLGYADFKGDVYDYSGNKIGAMLDAETVADTNNSVIGKVIDFKGVVNDECSFLGVIGTKGEIRNSRDVILGKILTNGQAISEVGNVVGFGVETGNVTDFDGKSLGTINISGRVLNYAQENLGCIRRDGRFYNADNHFIGGLAQPLPVINFENMIIGRSDLNGRLINDKSETIGYVRPDNTAISNEGEILGLLFKYKVAFDNDNNFLGRILENGNVVSDKNDVLGQVRHDGTVVADNKPIGYALYDFYIYDENGNTIGYLTRDGRVANFSGGNLGKADKGFLVDKNYALIGRGNRDYFIRDKDNQVIGELLLTGEVVDTKGETIGHITGSGEIRDDDANLLATARELQYYNVHKPEPVKPAEWATPPTGQIKVDAVPTPQEDVGEYGLKTVGIALTPDGNYLGDILMNNDVIDKLGNLLGKRMPDGLIMDDDGNLIGIEEAKNVKAGQMFVPAGTFGSGGAYGTGTAPTNLGPGGGFGPGERYDPVRAQALAAAQAARRGEITVGKLSTNVSREDFDGRQNYWEGVPRQISSWRVDMSEMILADKPIPAVLARTIMSSSSGGDVPVTAIVERNVYAEEGRNIIIPAGSRVMGTSSGGSGGGTSGGAVRVSITWTRLIRPDGSAFEFSSAQTGDAQGRSGALGYLDEQLLKKYTLPMVTNLLSSAVAYVAASGETSTDSDGNTVENARAEAAEDARQNFLDNMDTMFEQILQDKTDIEAVTYVPAGTRLIIYPKEDLWVRTPERSEEEALQDLQKPTVFIDDRNPTGTGGGGSDNSGAGGSAGGSSNTTTGTSPGASGVVYLDENAEDVRATMPLIDDTSTSGQKKPSSAVNIPPVTSAGATPPPPSSTAGSNNTSAQLF